MDECELVLLVTSFACAISKCYSNDELILLASVFSQLGDTLTTIIAKRDSLENNTSNGNKNTKNTCQKDGND